MISHSLSNVFRFAAVIVLALSCLASCSNSSTSNSGLDPQYSLTYHADGADGGSPPEDDTKYFTGHGVTVMDGGSLTKSGYQFGGWNTQIDRLGVSYGVGDGFLFASSDMNLYPVWIPNSLQVITGGGVSLVGYNDPPSGIFTIPPGVTSVVNGSFLDCTGITSLIVPSTVSLIGGTAFSGCTALAGVSFTGTSGVSFIESKAFASTALQSVSLPASVSSLAGDAFWGSQSLTEILVDAANTTYKSVSGVVLNHAQTVVVAVPAGIASYTVPSGVTRVGESAFSGLSNLSSVTLSSTVTRIDNTAFGDCDSLVSITIPASVTSMGAGVFMYCSLLATVTMPATPPSLQAGSNAFYNTSAGLQIHVPSSAARTAYQNATGWSDYAAKIVTP